MKLKFKFLKGSSGPTPPSDKQLTGERAMLDSRKIWDDIYGSAVMRYRASRRLNFILSGLLGISILGMIHIGGESKFIPYVTVVRDGQTLYGGIADQSNFDGMKGQLATYFVNHFVESARSVSVDGEMNKVLQKTAFALSTGAGRKVLSDFYVEQDPFKLAKTRTITVHIDYVNHLPGDNYQVQWTETSHNPDTGTVTGVHKFVATIQTAWAKPPQSAAVLQYNPFGFYITNISWTGVN